MPSTIKTKASIAPGKKNYPGAKTNYGILQGIISLMPRHDIFVELFLGTGIITQTKKPASLNFGIDKNPDMIQTDWQEKLIGSDYYFINIDAFDYLKIIKSGSFKGKTLLYADPPYLLSSRSCKKPLYKFEMTSDAEHENLLKELMALSCDVMISGYHSPLYDSMLSDWRLSEFNAIKRNGERAVECVWMNYPEPLELHDSRFLGKDFTDRQRIKRKRERMKNKLLKLPSLERQVLFETVDELRFDQR